MSADYSVKGKVGIVGINNPPVNSLNLPTRDAIYNCFKQAENDSAVEAIVVYGKGRTFPVGADLTEFSSTKLRDGASIIGIANEIEKCHKPVVAAIHQNVLGGGLELALGCHYRIATANTMIGFPEVQVGLLPGAGGTQRLPRVIGLENSMQWITTGKHHTADYAAKVGLIDRVVPKNTSILDAGVEFANSVIGKSLTTRRTSLCAIKDGNKVDELYNNFKVALTKKSRGAIAPFLCLESVRNSATCSFDVGLKKEWNLMDTLVKSNQAQAQIYAFFGQREIQKWHQPNSNVSYKTAKPIKVKSAAVIGLGTMGQGIAIALLRTGVNVIGLEMNDKFLKSGVTAVRNIIDDMLKRGLINSAKAAYLNNNFKGTTDYNDLRNVDLVIEAVFEDMSVKNEVFGKLDKACKPSAILASNTSGLDIDEIASATSRPDKVMGMHFFAPAHKMKLLENVFGEKSSPQTIATGMNVGRLMNKITVLAGNCRGFIGNRMYFQLTSEADFILEEGAYPMDVDKAAIAYGFAMGTFNVKDLSGNDIGYYIRKNRGLARIQQPSGAPERSRYGMRYCPLADDICERKRFGTKVGKGWHDYSPSNPLVPIASKEVCSLIDSYRAQHSITPRRIDNDEIIERLLYPLINEGFKILEEGFASSPLDIDMVWLFGYGWPIHTGGPMFYASTIGLPKLLKRLEYYHEKFGDLAYHWIPSKMIKWLATNHGNPPIQKWMKLWNNGGSTSKM